MLPQGVEKHAALFGVPRVEARWIDLANRGVSRDAPISGNVDTINPSGGPLKHDRFIAPPVAGPPYSS